MMCLVALEPHEVRAARKSVARLKARGQRRVHFAEESDQRRRQLLTAVLELPISVDIYLARERDQVASRNAILKLMVSQLGAAGVRRVTFDSRHGQDHRDRSIIHRALSPNSRIPLLYEHRESAHEPLLWVPDAIAWAWGRDGTWQSRVRCSGVEPTVHDVTL